MPDQLNTVPGAPCWIELSSSNVEQSLAFYAEVFDWEAVAGDYSGADGYITFYRSNRKLAGLMKNSVGAAGTDNWLTYLSAPDAAAAASAVETAGGSVVASPRVVRGMATSAIAVDPGGAAFGLWQPGEHEGYGLFGRHGSAVWHELHTRDYTESVAFYERAFGWTMESTGESDDFRYSRFVADGTPRAGIMDASRHLREGVASNWQVYFGVMDVDTTLGRILAHGGEVVEAPEDTPYGRLAGVTDSTGAYFKLTSVTDRTASVTDRTD